jgi:hypothetical protein
MTIYLESALKPRRHRLEMEASSVEITASVTGTIR